MRSSSTYPTYPTASLLATSQLPSLQASMAPMSVATIPAMPNTSHLVSAIPFVANAFPTTALPNYSPNSIGANFVGASTPSMLGIQAAPVALSASITPSATLPMSYTNSFAKPAYTTPAINSGYAYGGLPQVVAPYGMQLLPEYIPNDHHEVEDFYRQYDKALDRNSLLLVAKPQPQPEPPMPEPPMPEPMEEKVMDVVHGVEDEDEVSNDVHGVEHAVEEKVMDVVHGDEDKVSNVVHGVEHAVEEKVTAVEEKVHPVEEKVSNAVHAVPMMETTMAAPTMTRSPFVGTTYEFPPTVF